MRTARIALAAGFLAALATPLQAYEHGELEIPAFARKYGVSCSLCHAPAPRLTEFGERFAGNGFEFAVGEDPRDTVDTGDPLLRLMDDIPLAMRFDLFLQALAPEPTDRATFDLQTPWGIKLLSGGVIAPKVSYYAYFFMSERGEIAGLEDAYLQFTDIGGSGISVIAGQFQVSDPMFKRELRLEVEDYQPYRVRVGDARADLTYDRGLMASRELVGGDLVLMVVNGRGLEHARDTRVYDGDSWKNFAGHYSRSFGPLRLGAFGYWGVEEDNGIEDTILMFGPDATLGIGTAGELNLQYIRRTDDNPYFALSPTSTEVDAAMAEILLWPDGPAGRLFYTLLYNRVWADDPVFSLRVGETSPADLYEFAAGGISYLMARNLRAHGEVGWDFVEDRARMTIGVMAGF